MKFRSTLALWGAILLLGPFSSLYALNWDEAVDGDLSDDGNIPTVLSFGSGSNTISGTMGSLSGTGPMDADIWRFSIDPGFALTAINLIGYFAPTTGHQSFMAIDDAATINMADPSQHLSNGLWTEEQDGFGNTYTDLLGILDAGPEFGGQGFNGPIGPGIYTFWIQEGSEQIQYVIDFQVTPVPEPGSGVLLALVGVWVLRRRRRSGAWAS